MSFLSGSTASVAMPEQNLFGVEESRVSTNEQARPVPYMAGKTRVAVTFISNAFGVKAIEKKQKVGKGKSSVTGYTYYASFAALVCLGPVDTLHAILMDGVKVWEGTLSRSGDYADFTLTDYGSGQHRIYWGTSTQDADPKLSTLGHSAYRGMCYIVFDTLLFGYERTACPNIEVIVSRYPQPSWMSSPSANCQGDCNPVAVIAEWLQNSVYGLGLPEDRLDTESLIADATTLNSEGIGISPVISEAIPLRQAIVQACEYFDGYLKFLPNGKLTIGLVRVPSDLSALTVISEALLEDLPSIKPSGWSGTYNQTQVKYNNVDRDYKEDSVTVRDTGNLRITGEPNAQSLNRPWATRPALAVQIAGAASRINSLPSMTGQISLRRTTATDALEPGTLFKLTYAHLNLSNLLCRVSDKEIPEPGTPKLEIGFTLERGDLNKNFVTPIIDEWTEPEELTPHDFTHVKLLQDPEVTDYFYLMVLASAPDDYTKGFSIHKQLTGSGSDYKELGSFSKLSQYGTIEDAYPSNTATDDNTVGLNLIFTDTSYVLENLSKEDALTLKPALFIDNEILIIYGATLISANKWHVNCLRACWNTAAASHSAGAAFHLILWDDIPRQRIDNPGASMNFKLCSIIAGGGLLDIANSTVRNFTKSTELPLCPANLGINNTYGVGIRTWASGSINLTWSIRTRYSVPGAQSGNLPFTFIQLVDAGGTVKHTYTSSQGATSIVVPEADIADTIGSSSMTIRATGLLNGYYSQGWDPVNPQPYSYTYLKMVKI